MYLVNLLPKRFRRGRKKKGMWQTGRVILNSHTPHLQVQLVLPRKPKISYRYLKSGIGNFHRKYVLVPAGVVGWCEGAG